MSAKKRLTLVFDGPLMTGTLSTVKTTCGKPHCACSDDPKYHHGIYYRWTGVHLGKRTTKTMTKEAAEECKQRIKNYRHLQAQIKKLVGQEMLNAPW